ELVGDLLQVDRFALVDERGIARDDEKPAQLRQRGDDVLADAVGKIVLRRIVGHIGEGQYGDGWPVRQRQSRARWLAAFVRRGGASRCGGGRLAHIADEAKTLARDGTDQLLFLAAVADRLARRIDAAGPWCIPEDPAN